jgi:hypothetical protein
MARSLVVRRAELPKSGGELAQRAAQYVRMSTIHQRYSIENQATAIAAYAARYSLNIVRTYRDYGLSGLRIDKREGLKQLIADVCSGRAWHNFASLLWVAAPWDTGANETRGKLPEELHHLLAAQLPDEHNLALTVNAVDLENMLGEINANGANLHVDDPLR